jgi:archaellum component FlaF (FlaF/FlaG flagellin family)
MSSTRIAIGLATTASAIVIVASLLVVGVLYNDINNLYDDIMLDIGEFKVRYIQANTLIN